MTYKIARPEDYTDTEGYSYKLAKAYGQLSSDLLVMLVYLETLEDMIGVEYTDIDDIKERLNEIIKPYIES